MDSNSSFASPLANTNNGVVKPSRHLDFVVEAIANSGPWTIVFTILAALVAYDQSMYPFVLCCVDVNALDE